MAIPNDMTLYEKVKQDVYKRMPENSAYRSALIVKEYKSKGGTYSGAKKNEGITRWMKEKWETQNGDKVYKNKSDIFRPTIRVTKETPVTINDNA